MILFTLKCSEFLGSVNLVTHISQTPFFIGNAFHCACWPESRYCNFHALCWISFARAARLIIYSVSFAPSGHLIEIKNVCSVTAWTRGSLSYYMMAAVAASASFLTVYVIQHAWWWYLQWTVWCGSAAIVDFSSDYSAEVPWLETVEKLPKTGSFGRRNITIILSFLVWIGKPRSFSPRCSNIRSEMMRWKSSKHSTTL